MDNKQTIYSKLFEIKKQRVTLKKDTKAFNYHYATLDQIQTKLNPLLEQQQLLVIHYVESNSLVTKVINLENENDYVTSSIGLGELLKAQDKGSAITYYRRYNLVNIFDLEVEDDDGSKASKDSPKENHNPITPKERVKFEQKQFEGFTKDFRKYAPKYPTAESMIKMLDTQYIVDEEYKNKIIEFYKNIP